MQLVAAPELGYNKPMVPIERMSRQTRSIPLTPLIDVVFLLMVFFIVTTRYVDIEALPLTTASPAAYSPVVSQRGAPRAPHRVTLLQSGMVRLNDTTLHYGQLEPALRAALRKTGEEAVAIRCALGVSVQQLVDVLDMAKRIGAGSVRVTPLPAGEAIEAGDATAATPAQAGRPGT